MRLENDLQGAALVFIHEFKVRSQIIYIAILLAVFIFLGLLPFIFVTVSISSSGSIQSNIEKIEIKIPVNGRIIYTKLSDNHKVKLGEVLLKIDPAVANQEKAALQNQSDLLNLQLRDVSLLLKFKRAPTLQTGLYQASFLQYTTQLQQVKEIKDQAFHNLTRYQILYDKKVITQAEFETHQFKHSQSILEWEMVTRKYKTQWQTEVSQYLSILRELQNKQLQLKETEKQYVLTAELNGSVQNLIGIQKGTYVFVNQKIGEILPDGNLLGFCFVKSSDVGLIKLGQEVKFQIDAFNHNQWGMLSGKVLDISEHVIVQDQEVFFKVKCLLSRNYLRLKNGYKGQLKKGMTFKAYFKVTRRSLYQLLYDQVENWLDPA